MVDLIRVLSKKKYFLEIYVGILAFIVILGWLFNTLVGMIILLAFLFLVSIIFNDLKYGIPIILYLIFTISEGFYNNELPIAYIVIMALFIIFLIGFTFKKKIKYKKSILGILGLAIVNFIPIFWANLDNNIYYSFYFIGFGYLILYIMLMKGIKSSCIDILAVSMSYLSVILSIECLIRVIMLKDTVNSIFDLWYYLGWGLCNEAGILICMSIPFSFYLLGKCQKDYLLQIIKILIACVGVIMTMSRGTYLFGALEVFLLAFILLFYTLNKKLYKKIFIGFIALGVIGLIIVIPYVDDIMLRVFKDGLSSNGRIDIWQKGLIVWKESLVKVIFGPGICSVMESLNTAVGIQEVPLVFHSTIIEVLVVGGIVGAGFFIIHLYEKYRALLKMDKLFMITSLIGYIIVDLYGLIDNTYFMYYYMIVLMVIMASIDKKIEFSGVM